jgi:hypothetical protein
VLTCLGGIRFWPLTAKVGLFRAPMDKVVRAAQPWRSGRGSPWRTTRHPSLAAALESHAPYPYFVDRAVVAATAGGGAWTAVVNTGFPFGDVVGFLQARARLDVRCEYVGLEWMPATPEVFGNATFVHFLPPPQRLRRPAAPGDTRWVQTSDQDGGWEFYASGVQRPFEEPDRYRARRKADRLDLDLLARYLRAAGIQADDPGWLHGPAVMAVRSEHRPGTATWSTAGELRALCGYPQDRVPPWLMGWSGPR